MALNVKKFKRLVAFVFISFLLSSCWPVNLDKEDKNLQTISYKKSDDSYEKIIDIRDERLASISEIKQ